MELFLEIWSYYCQNINKIKCSRTREMAENLLRSKIYLDKAIEFVIEKDSEHLRIIIAGIFIKELIYYHKIKHGSS